MLARLASWLGRWPIALALCVVLAAAILLPGLGGPGLWEPQERALSDLKAPRAEIQKERDKADADAEAAKLAAKAGQGSGSGSGSAAPDGGLVDGGLAKPPKKAAPATPPPDPEDCPHSAPKDATARSLTGRAAAWGRDTFGDDDAGRRLPLALLGLLTALAIAGTTMALAGPRAGLLACIVGLSFPLLILQSRQLTSEIGTACGASLVIYGAVALGRARATALGAIEAVVAALALAAGLYLGFAGGGALLGMIVPLGAVALAGLTSLPARREAGGIARLAVTVVATAAALALLAYLIHQVYDLSPPKLGASPPPRAVFGKAIVSSPCWSTALGGTWRGDDDTRMIFDSTWEQIAYGTYPWGVLAPIAIAALIGSRDARRRRLGALALAWAGCAWIATEVFARKVGVTLFAGFPALAIAVGAWLDGLLAGGDTRAAADDDGDDRGIPRGALLIGVFAILATIDIGKDMVEFADKTTAMLVGGEGLAYPTQAHLFALPAKLWVFLLGALVGLGAGLALVQIRPSRRAREVALACGIAAISMTIVFGAFWAFAWQPTLADHLSSKAMFETYLDLRKPGDQLVMMGDLGDAPHDYAPDAKPEIMSTREQVVQALGRPGPARVFAIAPQGELCQLHREVGGKPYFVVDDRNTRDLLLSNRIDGTTDKNPLRDAIVHTQPENIPIKPKAKIVFDNRIELLGWDIPKSVGRGEKFVVTMYYRVLQNPGGTWKVLFHFDGPSALRFNGDHAPIDERCATSTWQPGDFIIDRHTVTAGAGAFQTGKYDVWTGFFTGSSPNFKNMPISEAPGDMRDPAATDRVKMTTILLE